jgi:hypothetical protein
MSGFEGQLRKRYIGRTDGLVPQLPPDAFGFWPKRLPWWKRALIRIGLMKPPPPPPGIPVEYAVSVRAQRPRIVSEHTRARRPHGTPVDTHA